jgi:hypothetical protein
MEIVGRRLFGLTVLQQEQHHAVARKRAVHPFNRHGPIDAERRDGHREHDRFAQRDHRQL